MRAAKAAVLGIFAFPALWGDAESAMPERVVSLDHCADEYLLALADRKQIAAVSMDAGREFSYYAAAVRGVKRTTGAAEDVLAFEPDLVLRFFGGGYRAEEMLRRFGVRVVTLEEAKTFDGIRTTTRAVGMALGQFERAETLLAQMDRTLAAEPALPPRRALYITPGGVTAGGGTLIDHILKTAGLRTQAEQGVQGWVRLDLEAILMSPPEAIVASFFDHVTARTDHWSLASNSVLRRIMRETPTVTIPSRLMTCGAPFAADAVAAIRRGLGSGRLP